VATTLARSRRPRAISARVAAVQAGYRGLRPVLFSLGGGDAEVAHETTLTALGRIAQLPPALRLARAVCGSPATPVELAGLRFAGPVGLAAGVDKNGLATRAWSSLGLSHAELGTVTAHPQPGNPRPRLFRLPTSEGIVNRMGFNNAGAHALAARLASYGIRRGNGAAGMIIGISIGKSKITPVADAVADYLTSLRAVAPYADYVAINVSSPNTPGLRSLQDKGLLAELTSALVAEAGDLPVLVKLAPDLTDEACDEAVAVCEDAGVAGLIATNTTVDRTGVCAIDRGRASEAGGLSGRPLTRRALAVVRRLTSTTELPVIGVGGILTATDAEAMLDAGARLVQLYTGLIYRGPGLVSAINTAAVARTVPTETEE